MKAQVITYLYPKAIPYLPQLVESLNHQTKGDFEVMVFNDGVEDHAQYFSALQNNVRFENVEGTPMAIRFSSLEYLRKKGADFLIFQDADDQMSANRVEVTCRYLEKYSVVVNELSLSNEKGDLIQRRFWSDRLRNNYIFTADFIRDKNIVGFGNTALRRDALTSSIRISHQPLAPDWFIFYQLLEKGGLEAVFTDECQTIYRQHRDNMAGVKEANAARVRHIVSVKLAHYRGLHEAGYDFASELERYQALGKRIDSQPINNINKITSPFWWEETTVV